MNFYGLCRPDFQSVGGIENAAYGKIKNKSRHPPSTRQTLEFGGLPGRAELRQMVMPAGNHLITTNLLYGLTPGRDAEICCGVKLEVVAPVVKRKLNGFYPGRKGKKQIS